MRVLIIILSLSFSYVLTQDGWSLVGNPLLDAHPCINETSIIVSFEPNLPPDEKNQYSVVISKKVPKHTQINIKFDTEAIVTLGDKSKARITTFRADVFNIRFFNDADFVSFTVKGPATGTIPYFESLVINNVEYCKNPLKGYLDSYISGYKETAETNTKVLDESCGRRKISHTELLVNGADTNAGDWPWHVAIYRVGRATAKYICGGTLLSKNFVLTAAHCATVRGEPILPEILNVVLGMYNLYGGDTGALEKRVFGIILHENFNYKLGLDNDIALLKLKTEVTFTDYVQPSCLWTEKFHERSPTKEIIGTIVGWGFDQDNEISSKLRQATMPVIPENVCYKSNPLFYAKVLHENKFCAGFKNGTSACNGDSGGGLFVFIPDVPHDAAASAQNGAWYLKGLVSLTVSKRDQPVCDPTQYVVFTDVSKYNDWIESYVE